MRKFQCLKPKRQTELASQFSWLPAVQEDRPLPPEVKTLNLSVFDHWLSELEAETLISASSKETEVQRELAFANFYSLLVDQTEVLSVAWRGLRKDRLRFRSFTSPSVTLHYLQTSGCGLHSEPRIQFVLPHFSAVYYQGWDSTSHFYIAKVVETGTISEWANQAGLHILP